MNVTLTTSRRWLVPLTCLALCGCAGTETLVSWFGNDPPQAGPRNPVIEVYCLWQPGEGTGLKGVPSRGFAGQVMFFTRKEKSPVVVDGDVRIYLFGNHGTPEERAKPIHQFDFLGDAWQKQLQTGTLGPTYQLFIPHVRDDLMQTEAALQVRFTPKEGPTVFSELVRVTLPGRPPQSERDRYEPLDLAGDASEHPARRSRLERAENLLLAARAQRRPAIEQTGHARESDSIDPIEPAGGGDPDEARLQRIEQMLSDLMAARREAAPARPPATPHPLAAHEPSPPREAPRRYRLTGPEEAAGRHPLGDEVLDAHRSESPLHPLKADRSENRDDPAPRDRSRTLDQWSPDTGPRGHHPLHPLMEQ